MPEPPWSGGDRAFAYCVNSARYVYDIVPTKLREVVKEFADNNERIYLSTNDYATIHDKLGELHEGITFT